MDTQPSTQEKIDLDDLIGDYIVENIPAFQSYLKQVWKDLLGRSDNKEKGVNKITFSKYYELPGIISDRLFNVFNTNKNNYLSCNDFVDGMVKLFSGDLETLLHFIFCFYDFDKDGKVSKEDMRIVLSYVPLNIKRLKKKKTLKFEKENFDDRLESQSELHDKLDFIFQNLPSINEEQFKEIVRNKNSDLFLYILVFLLEKRPFNNETVKNLENIRKSPSLLSNKSKMNNLIASPNLNSKFTSTTIISKSPRFQSRVAEALNGKKKINKLGADLAPSKNLLDLYSGNKAKQTEGSSIQLNIPNKKDNGNNNNNDLTKNKPSRKLHKQINKNLESIDNPSKFMGEENVGLSFARPYEKTEIAKSKGSSLNDSFESGDEGEDKDGKGMEGYIYKKQEDKIKQIYFKLICKDLYYYKSKEDTKHKGMHNLSGVYLKEEEPITLEGKQFYTFIIVFPSKERKYYVLDKNEYQNWLIAIRKAVGYSNLNEIYEVRDVLGKGKFGLVRLGIHKESGRKVAIKIINKKLVSLLDLEQVKTEVEILKIAQHPNIIRLYDVFENEKYIYIIMEHCGGGDLFSYIEKRGFQLKEPRAAQIIHKLSTAIYYLHQYGIVHRDLKPENILMTDESDEADIRLLDFGLGKIIGPNEFCTEPFGTFSYAAPEVLLEKPYNFKADLWTIGIITYLLVAGFLPFDDENSEKEIARQTVYEPTPFPNSIWKNISNEAKAFVDNLLNKDPKKRMNIKQILEHPWLKKFITSDEEIFVRRGTSNLSGGEEFKAFATTSKDTTQK